MKWRSSLLLFWFNLISVVLADLRVGFYQPTCPQAEDIVRGIVKQQFSGDKTIPAALLRMHFHDCFVHGCDASILIDSTSQNQAEKEAVPNQTVRGWELIDQIKEALEAACPNNVSCADIITLATRDAVALAGGPNYAVPTGRRDGPVSSVDDVDLPDPTLSIPDAAKFFKDKGLTLADMATLLGGHTVGVSHCSFFKDRFTTDTPSMDSVLEARLKVTCTSPSNTVSLDQNTSFVVDNEYYKQVLSRRGILKIDQELADDASTAEIVSGFAKNGTSFMQNFANAMVKLGRVQVLVGTAGEVRTNCRLFNSKNNVNPPPPPTPRISPPPPPPSPPPPAKPENSPPPPPLTSPPPPLPPSRPAPAKPTNSPPPPPPTSPPAPPPPSPRPMTGRGSESGLGFEKGNWRRPENRREFKIRHGREF